MENINSDLPSAGNQPDNQKIFDFAKRIKSLAQTGLLYCADDYNKERYTELEEISNQIFSLTTGNNIEQIRDFYLDTKEYPTAKCDIRVVIFNERDEILMVREVSDNKWSLPGGWADIGYTPSEVAIKETAEETGYIVQPKRLLAVLDKKKYDHPPQPEYVYKIFIECIITGGEPRLAHDVSEIGFFPQHQLPELSTFRIVKEQLNLMFSFLHNDNKQVIFD